MAELVRTNTLHNHTRMWFASIWIFTLGLPWALGADFFYRHLLDGDPASNTLGWRWVAGLHTRGKHYVARPDNIARYTDGRFTDVTGLAADPEPLAEHGAIERVPVTFEAPSPGGRRTGLLLHPDDCLPEHAPWSQSRIDAVAAGWPSAVADAFDLAEPVVSFSRRSLDDACARAAGQHRVEWTPLGDGDLAAAALSWTAREVLDYVVIPFAPVGPWQAVTKTASNALEGAGIRVSRPARAWDRDLYPHATGGFFAFRRAIPETLDAIERYVG